MPVVVPPVEHHFDSVQVWSDLGGAVRVNRNGTARVVDPTTGATLTVTQNGQPTTLVKSDAKGQVSFIADQDSVNLVSGNFITNHRSAEFSTGGTSVLADAQAAATRAETAATAAANAATSIPFNVMAYGAVGDGVADDTAAIQAALNAAPSGSVVRIPKKHKITAELKVTKSNLVIDASGATISAYWPGTGSGDYVMLSNGQAGDTPTAYTGNGSLTFIGGIWDARGHANSVSFSSPFALAHADRVTFDRVTMRNVRRGHGIDLTACRSAKFLGCRFEGYTDIGDPRLSEAIQIDIASSSATFPRFGAYDSTSCDDVVVSGCTFTSSADCGLWPRAVGSHNARTDRPQTNIRVTGCRINAYESAVRAYNWSRFTIADNTIESGPIQVLAISAATPDDNTKNAAGLQTNASASIGEGTISGNVIRASSWHGIELNSYPVSGIIRGVTVSGNTITGQTGTSSTRGIWVEAADACSIIGNYVTDSPSQGIRVDSGCTGVVVADNVIRAGQSHGIMVDSSSSCIVNGNQVTNAGEHGISLSGTGTDNSVRGNTVVGSSVVLAACAGIRVNTVSNTSVVGNLVRSGSSAPAFGLQIASAATGTFYVANDLRVSGSSSSVSDAGSGSLTSTGNLTTGGRSSLVYGTYKPSSATTGVLPDVVRTPYNGNRTINVAGTVIENQDITGYIRIRAANVTIRNCRFVDWIGTPTGDSAFIDCNSPSVSNAIIEDVTIDPNSGHYYLYGINGWNFTARRVNIRTCVDGFQPYNTAAPGGNVNVSILGCLVEEFYFSAVPSGVHSDLVTHNDAIQIQDGRGVTAVGNLFDMHYSQTKSNGTPPSNGIGTDGRPRPTGSCTAVMYTPNFSTRYVGPCSITDNWIYGGSYPINAGSTGGFDIGTFKRNKFDHNQGTQNLGGDQTRVILLAKDNTGTGGTAATVVDLGTGTEANVYEDNLVAVPVQYA